MADDKTSIWKKEIRLRTPKAERAEQAARKEAEKAASRAEKEAAKAASRAEKDAARAAEKAPVTERHQEVSDSPATSVWKKEIRLRTPRAERQEKAAAKAAAKREQAEQKAA